MIEILKILFQKFLPTLFPGIISLLDVLISEQICNEVKFKTLIYDASTSLIVQFVIYCTSFKSVEQVYELMFVYFSDNASICRLDNNRLVPVLLSVGAAAFCNEASCRDGGNSGRLSGTFCQWEINCQNRKTA